jgi:hypothetical protein
VINLLVGLGVGRGVAQVIAYVVLPLLLLGGIVWALDAWGDSRYDAGVADTDAAWKAASDKALQQASVASEGATRNEVARLLEHQARVEEEKEAIDAAIANGSSPIDALFPAANGM